MFATLLAVVVALVLGHVAPSLAAAVRDYGWYQGWLRWLDSRFTGDGFWRGPWGVALAVLPPLLLVALLQLALDGPLFGLPALLFGVLVLFYTWGPRDLDRDVDAIVEAPDASSRAAAMEALRPSLRGVDAGVVPTEADAIPAVFRAALRRWFGVLFWFLLLGAFGALLYRLAALAAAEDSPLPAGTASGARALLAALDWPVAQLMTLSMALVGDFDVVVTAWKAGGGAAFALDADFLGAAGRASVRSELADEAADYFDDGLGTPGVAPDFGPMPGLRDAMGLVWRILLAWLAVIALFVIAGWVG